MTPIESNTLRVLSMLSEKATRILRRIGSFTEEQLEGMSEAEAWHHIYAHDQAKSKTEKAKNPEVCFTGFTEDQKAVLTESAIQAGFTVRDSFLELNRWMFEFGRLAT